MQDYQGNSNKAKAEQEKPAKQQKHIEKVIIGEVIVPKKTVGRKAKDLVLDMDLKGVAKHVFFAVMLPSAKNLAYDAWVESGKRTIFKGATPSGRSVLDPRSLVQRITYNSPVARGVPSSVAYPRDPREVSRMAPNLEQGPRRSSLTIMDSLVLSSQVEAEKVIETMLNIIDKYEVATVQDLKEIIGLPPEHIDNKWGWVSFTEANVRQIREGYLLEFLPPEPVSNF